MSKKIRPSIIFQRTVSLVNGPRQRVQNYSAIDASQVARPVSIGATHVHAAAVALENSRVLTTARVNADGTVADASGHLRPVSAAAVKLDSWVSGILKGEF